MVEGGWGGGVRPGFKVVGLRHAITQSLRQVCPCHIVCCTDSRVVSSGGKNVSSQARKSLRNPGVPQDQAVMDQPFLQVHSLKFILW